MAGAHLVRLPKAIEAENLTSHHTGFASHREIEKRKQLYLASVLQPLLLISLMLTSC